MKLRKIAALALAVIMLAGVLMTGAVSAAEEMPFRDVAAGKWFYDAVKYVWERELMTGVAPDRFEPNGSMTRAMFVTVLGRLAGAEGSETNPFPDAKSGTWYSKYVGWAVDRGIVKGYEDGTFRPDTNLSREEMAACMARYIDAMGLNMPRENDAVYEFTDDDRIAGWAEGYVDVLRTAGIVRGDDNVNYNPKSEITRAEMATLIGNLIRATEKTWQGYMPKASDSSVIYGAKYLYWSGNYVQGGFGTDIDESGDYPALAAYTDTRAAKQSYEPGDTVGFSATAAWLDVASHPIVKICYAYDGTEETGELTAYASNRYAMEGTYTKRELALTPGGEDAGYMTATADLTALAEENFPGTHFSNKAGDNLHIMFKPFAGEVPEGARFKIRYIAFFADEAAAAAFESKDKADYLENYYLYTNVNYEEVTSDTVDGYLAAMRKRVQEIKNSPSAVTPEDIKASGGKVYYVSSINGDDSNDGLSPETAWKSPQALWSYREIGSETLQISKLRPGDGVFFERGSIFYPEKFYNHGMSTLEPASYVTYGAYGEGEKPIFTMSLDFGGGTGEWSKTEWEDIYVLDVNDYVPEGKENFAREDGDIGALLFNDGELMGVRVFPNDAKDPFGDGKTTKYIGHAGNCRDYYISGGTTCKDPNDALRNNLEFIHDFKEGKLYLRCEDGNPADIFKTIRACRNGNIVYGVLTNSQSNRFDNLAFLYSGYIGLDLRNGDVVTNCEAGYCGGDTGSVGTGIGGYGACESLVVENCYIHDVEDGPMGTQYTSEDKGVELNNVILRNNVIVAAQNLVELFHTNRKEGPDGLGINKICHARVSGNYAAYLGYGYPRFVDEEVDGLALHNWYYGEMVDCIFEDNTMINCQGSIIGAHVATDGNDRGWFMRNNTYVMNPKLVSMLRGTDGITFTNLSKSFYASYQVPYSERYIAYLASLGIDPSGKYYSFDGMTPGEAFGSFVMNGYHFERGDLPS